MGRLQKILAKMRKNFPELHNLTIRTRFARLSESHLEVNQYDDGSYTIEVDAPTFFTAPKEVIMGGLAHELGHIIREEQKTPPGRKIGDFLYNKFFPYKDHEERQADQEAINHHYEDQLETFSRYADDPPFGRAEAIEIIHFYTHYLTHTFVSI